MIYLCEFLTEWETVEKLYGENRPLSNDQRSIIDYNRHQLAQQMAHQYPECGIIDQLHDSKCFNQLHKDHIKSGNTSFDKADLLLDIMRRRSLADLKKLADFLCRYGCPRLAQLLNEGGGTQSLEKFRYQCNLVTNYRLLTKM